MNVSPNRFPSQSFIALGGVWVAIDLLVMFTLWSGNWIGLHGSAAEVLGMAWFAILSAKFMLLLGWLTLGEGASQKRLLGALLLSPILIPPLILGLFEPEVFCLMLGLFLVAVPVSLLLSFPYALIWANDYRLARAEVAPRSERQTQFTLRQMMLVTLAAGVVMGLLRWAHDMELKEAVFVLQVPVLAWAFPLAATPGVLSVHWYPQILYATGTALYLLALPFATLPIAEAGELFLFVGTYVAFFATHLLLLRWMGYRLTRMPPLWKSNAGITFLEHVPDPGIHFFD